MDPFTQRMLERARARQEKIDQKLASSGQTVPKRKPLSENITHLKSETPKKSPIKPSRDSLTPKKSLVKSDSPVRSQSKRVIQKQDSNKASPQKCNDFIVTKKEYRTPKRSSSGRRNSDVSVEINIMHRDDIQIEVQVEERDAPLNVVYETSRSNVQIKEIEDEAPKKPIERENSDMSDKAERSGLRHNIKSRLDRLGILYSDKAELSSPIHRTELEFSSATPPATEFEKMTPKPRPEACKDGRRKFGRLAALADQINNWEDDLTHHGAHPEPTSNTSKPSSKADTSTLDVSIHSLNDINKALKTTGTPKESPKSVNSRTYTKPVVNNEVQLLNKKVVAELEPSAPTPSAAATLNMATMVAVNPPTPKLNGDRSSVLSKAAMFEAGSPKAKDPAEMSLRERKALFEKNKGAAIVPKAPFGQAPSARALLGNNKADSKPTKPVVHTTPTKSNSRNASKENIPDDISQSSVGGIKGKLAALFNKEQTISESTIANKFKQEREKEMEMLQNRFQYKPKPEPSNHDESDHDDPSEDIPLMGSTMSLSQASKKPSIISNIPKVTFEKTQSVSALNHEEQTDNVAQAGKRRSSQDSPIVLSVLDDVKRIKVNNVKKEEKTNGAVTQQPGLYPHLSDIETDTSHTQEEYSDCGGSRCGHYALECVFFFLCI